MKKISDIELRLCSICQNRSACISEKSLYLLGIPGEKFSHRDLIYFKKGDFIFKEGNEAEGVFCIYHGNVQLFRKEDRGEKIIQAKVPDGDVIGFNSIVDGYFINSALAMDDTFCCFLKIAEVQQLIRDQSPIQPKIISGQERPP